MTTNTATVEQPQPDTSLEKREKLNLDGIADWETDVCDWFLDFKICKSFPIFLNKV